MKLQFRGHVFPRPHAEPEMPGLVSALSPQQQNLVVNIVGPSAWNSNPVGFHVHWQATSERRGPHGDLHIALPADWSPEENVLYATLPLQGGMDYRLSVSAVGTSCSGVTFQGPEVELEASVPLCQS
ncbi:hypothetical protein V5799_006676 [Amblyomma americanum]|uniref:Uncharacterized protein n=1 Tax=Amblyomma americanum TaxID=6943 RepID=A0AAQ4DVQ2_AMBAM